MKQFVLALSILLSFASAGRTQISSSPAEDRHQGLTFLTAYSKGYLNDSINKWDPSRQVTEKAFQIFKDNGFNAVLIGYAPLPQYAPNGVKLPDQRFNYDPVDVADAKGLKAIIDLEKYIKPNTAIFYSDDAKAVIAALNAKTSGKGAIAAIHLYGEVDSYPRGKSVNAVAAQVKDFATLAVAQEGHIDVLASMKAVVVPAGNYDDPQDLVDGYTETSNKSFAKLSGYTNGFWYLVPWVRDYSSNTKLPWRSIYAAVGMGARGIIWTQSADVGYIFDRNTGEMKAMTQYVEDINKQLLDAGLDNLISADWKAGKLSPQVKQPDLQDGDLLRELMANAISLNPTNDVYHAGLFAKCQDRQINFNSKSYDQKECEYYVLLLNWQNVAQKAVVKLDVNQISEGPPAFLSKNPPVWSFSGVSSISENDNTVNFKDLNVTLPPHGIALLKLQGREITVPDS